MKRAPRSLKLAISNAERIRAELPKLIQPDQSAYDIVTILDALRECERDAERWKNDAEIAQANWHAACHDLETLSIPLPPLDPI